MAQARGIRCTMLRWKKRADNEASVLTEDGEGREREWVGLCWAEEEERNTWARYEVSVEEVIGRF